MISDKFAAFRKGFLDDSGRLKAMPAKQSKKLLALEYLWGKFEESRVYTEGEVNALINEWHTFDDHCALRRELYDHYYMDRDKDGTNYRKGAGPKKPEQ